jgi:hypothetical protein
VTAEAALGDGEGRIQVEAARFRAAVAGFQAAVAGFRSAAAGFWLATLATVVASAAQASSPLPAKVRMEGTEREDARG